MNGTPGGTVTSPKKMGAVICARYGPPEVLQLTQVDMPVPKGNEVRIRIQATTVTAADYRVRSFTVPLSFWLPGRLALGLTRPKTSILGAELAGEVESVGREVSRFKEGDRVCALTGHGFGGYAEYACLSEGGFLAKIPARVTFEEAAALPMGGLTALHFLREGEVRSGSKVLIYGASGSVGTYAVQLAKHLGAEVTGVCGTSNRDLVRSLGADVVMDYTKEDFTKRGETYDVILDAVGKGPFPGSLRPLRRGGTYLHVVAAPGLQLRMRLASLTTGQRLIGGKTAPRDEDLPFLIGLVEKGELRCVIDRRYPLERIVEAHRYADKGHKRGNVVITVDQFPGTSGGGMAP